MSHGFREYWGNHSPADHSQELVAEQAWKEARNKALEEAFNYFAERYRLRAMSSGLTAPLISRVEFFDALRSDRR